MSLDTVLLAVLALLAGANLAVLLLVRATAGSWRATGDAYALSAARIIGTVIKGIGGRR